MQQICMNLRCCPWLFPQISGIALNVWTVLTVWTLVADPVLTMACMTSLQACPSVVSSVTDGGLMSNDSKSNRKSQTAGMMWTNLIRTTKIYSCNGNSQLSSSRKAKISILNLQESHLAIVYLHWVRSLRADGKPGFLM